jgi:hypothetical protein
MLKAQTCDYEMAVQKEYLLRFGLGAFAVGSYYNPAWRYNGDDSSRDSATREGSGEKPDCKANFMFGGSKAVSQQTMYGQQVSPP